MVTSVILVDGDAAQLKTMRATLSRLFPRVRVHLAGTTEEALFALRRASGLALVVTDLAMSGADGLILLREVRKACPEAERWLFTTAPLLDLAPEALADAEPHGLVAKSEGIMGLARAFRAVGQT